MVFPSFPGLSCMSVSSICICICSYKRSGSIKSDFTETGSEVSLLCSVSCTDEFCEYGRVHSASVKAKNFLNSLLILNFSRKDLVPWNETCVVCVTLIILFDPVALNFADNFVFPQHIYLFLCHLCQMVILSA